MLPRSARPSSSKPEKPTPKNSKRSAGRNGTDPGDPMKLLTFLHHGRLHAGIFSAGGVAPIEEVNARHGTRIPNNLLEIIRTRAAIPDPAGVPMLPLSEIQPRLPYATPPKIWCIGLNYRSHAEDIQAVQPEEPGSFMKPASCMF